jgi:acyl dehydratase
MTLAQADVCVGFRLPPARFPVRRVDLIRYAGAAADFNEIHWNPRFAQTVGLPDVIAHGMYTMAVAVRVVTDWLGDPGAVLDYGVRFTRPVVVPDPDGAVIDVTAVVAVVGEDGTARVNVTAAVDGQTVLARSRVTVRLPRS